MNNLDLKKREHQPLKSNIMTEAGINLTHILLTTQEVNQNSI
jgi:hypothetical protein